MAPHLRCLTLPQTITRRFIMQKARGPPLNPAEAENHRAPTACKCMVSGTFNSPNRGTFHRSVALLFTIGRRVVLSLGGCPPQLHRVPRAPCYSGTPAVTQGSRFCLQDYHLLWSDFPDRSACDAFVTAYRRPQPQRASPLVWANPLSLATTNGVSVDFFSYRY